MQTTKRILSLRCKKNLLQFDVRINLILTLIGNGQQAFEYFVLGCFLEIDLLKANKT